MTSCASSGVAAPADSVWLRSFHLEDLMLSALDNIEEGVCGDFATFGSAELPFPGLSIQSPSDVNADGIDGGGSSGAAGAAPARDDALRVALPPNALALQQLKSHCSPVPSTGAVTPSQWQLSAKHFNIENPAFDRAVHVPRLYRFDLTGDGLRRFVHSSLACETGSASIRVLRSNHT